MKNKSTELQKLHPGNLQITEVAEKKIADNQETTVWTENNSPGNISCGSSFPQHGKKTNGDNILMSIKNKKWTWAGHVMCRADNKVDS